MDFQSALQNLNYLAIITAALSTFLVGGLWYSPILFGNAWMKENNFTSDMVKGGEGKIFGSSFILALIAAFNLALFIGPADFGFSVTAGALVGLGWVATSYGITYLFERKSLKLFFINAGYQLLAFILMGAILGLWK